MISFNATTGRLCHDTTSQAALKSYSNTTLVNLSIQHQTQPCNYVHLLAWSCAWLGMPRADIQNMASATRTVLLSLAVSSRPCSAYNMALLMLVRLTTTTTTYGRSLLGRIDAAELPSITTKAQGVPSGETSQCSQAWLLAHLCGFDRQKGQALATTLPGPWLRDGESERARHEAVFRWGPGSLLVPLCLYARNTPPLFLLEW